VGQALSRCREVEQRNGESVLKSAANRRCLEFLSAIDDSQ